MKKFILTAGGSGGHVFPAQALAKELISRGHEVVFITDRRGTSFSSTFPSSKEFRIFAGAYANLSKIRKIKALFSMGIGIVQSICIILKIKPNAVIGFGGYASFPAAFASEILDIPLIIHEQNSVLGGANRFLARQSSIIATTFPKVKKIPENIKTSYTGVPVRPEILSMNSLPYPKNNDKFKLLIFGGSQGAKIFSKIIPEAIKLLPIEIKENLQISQQARSDDLNELKASYEQSGLKVETASFFNDIAKRLKETNLLICRAGASTIAELTTTGTPAIIVPMLHSPDSHQLYNAKFIEDNHACILMEEKTFTAENLSKEIIKLYNDRNMLEFLSENAKKLAKLDAVSLFADTVLNNCKNK
ncbi:MAG: undecaprenyldiphospho-muramoylpentapeptide beta-N-acetylglucosaminyltransferase [Alphaproteobacteria bacterium]|nr:undecaprenyldiphospho-muramoylpentapeptide beta-N-acetylglucosaminyltransferase [Alphaproteobacteria bacterium]